MDPTTEGAAGAGEQSPITVVQAPADASAKFSISDAARTLAKARAPKQQEQQQAGEQREDAQPRAAEESPTAPSGASEDAGEREALPGETESVDPATTELPSIEPPRSWTKADKELFASLPRETQERLAERERSRDSDFSRRQQTATEQAKALEAERSKVEQARQQYDNALPQLLQTLQQQQAGEFADVKTIADVERLAREDWPRYLQWDLSQKKIAAVQQETLAAQQRQVQEKQQKFAQFASAEDKLLLEKVPELADAKKMAELQSSAMSALKAIGFDDAELGQSWNGQKDLSLRDHRVQLLIRDAALWRDAQAKAKAATAKTVPPVQRPGVSQPKGAAQAAEVENLSKKLETSSGVNALRTAAKLVATRRASRA